LFGPAQHAGASLGYRNLPGVGLRIIADQGAAFIPQARFRIGEKVDDPISMYLNDVFTLPVNIAGLPGTSVPCGFVRAGGSDLPVGLQVIAKPFDEPSMLRVAHAYEQATDWHTRRPEL